MSSTSGFILPTDAVTSRCYTDITLLPSSGHNQLARAKRLGRWWMLKGLKEEFRGQGIYEALLQKEFEQLSHLQHPSIVSAVDIDSIEGLGTCIVMEWIDGQTLKEWLCEKHTARERLAIATQVADALAYVHSRQMVHRDLKPSNIMVTRSGQNVKLIDFGLSDSDNYTILKQPAGTPGYLSPEQQEQRVTDVRNDIYSFGCVLRDLHLPALYSLVVRRCLAPQSKRYSSMTAVRAALRRQSRLPQRLLMSAALLSIIFCVATIIYMQRMDKRENTAVADTLQTQIDNMRQKQQARMTQMRRRNDSLQTRLNQLETEKNTTEHRQQRIQKIISDGKRQIDRMAITSGLQTYYDTLRTLGNNSAYEKEINRLGTTFTSLPTRYVESLPSDITEQECAQIQNVLTIYMNDRYWKRWMQRFLSIEP